MEYYQKRYIREAVGFPAITAGLLTIDLPNKGLLSGIEIRVHAKTGASAGLPDLWIHDALTRVELIVNGSQVVKSLSGNQIKAMNMYEKTYADLETQYNVASDTQVECFYLNLGRWYHDDEYMLDLGRVNDPELRIHYNFTNPATYGWGNVQAFAAVPLPSIYVIPHLLRESAKVPLGYLKTSEIYRFTGTGAQFVNMTIPRGPTYCGLYLQCWYKNEGLSDRLDHLELNLDNDRLIPFRVDRNDLRADMERKYGRFHELQIISATCGEEYPAPIEDGDWWEQTVGVNDVQGGEGVLWADNMTIAGIVSSGGGAAAGTFTRLYHFVGTLPFSVAKIPYFNLQRPESWIDSRELGDFWVRVEETAGTGLSRTWKLLGDEVVTTYL